MIKTVIGSVVLSLGAMSTPVFANSTASFTGQSAGAPVAEWSIRSSIEAFAPDVLRATYPGVSSIRPDAVMPAEGVPEPTEVALLSIGLLALALGRGWRRRSSR